MKSPGVTAAGILATSPAIVLHQNGARIALSHTTHEHALTAPLHLLLLLPLTHPQYSLSLCRRTPRFGNAPDVTNLGSMSGILAAHAAVVLLHPPPHAQLQTRHSQLHIHPTVLRPLPYLPVWNQLK